MTDRVEQLTAALVDRYRIERQLGEGGMARVYLAHDLKHERPVAIKVLKPEVAVGVGTDRFLQEIRVTANLQHPHILPLFDSGAAVASAFYVMPYVSGESLRDRLARDRRLGLEEALSPRRVEGEGLVEALLVRLIGLFLSRPALNAPRLGYAKRASRSPVSSKLMLARPYRSATNSSAVRLMSLAICRTRTGEISRPP